MGERSHALSRAAEAVPIFFFVFVFLATASSGVGFSFETEKSDKAQVENRLQNSTENHIPGKWSKNRLATRRDNLSQSEADDLARLMALPYAQGVRKAPDIKTVTIYKKTESRGGFNFYISGHGPEAFLMDMEGNIIHKWHYGIENIWPHLKDTQEGSFWRRSYLYPNGDILAIFEGIGIIKLNKDSKLLWAYKGGVSP